jgi:Uma2 family endonuclease
MLDIPVHMGVNAPKQHQRIIAKLTARIYWLYQEKLIEVEPLPEVMINEAQTSPTPDVILFSEEEYTNKVIIEVTTPTTFKKDFEKVELLVKEYEVEEGFVYDYIKNRWRKYKNGFGEVTTNPSFCDTIGYDLNDFVK